ncbi:hypothetical protein KW797_03625 [Candidatus Parcubacteria bacterium]|nr:hypothetical protein [Candidatus Parcubacteria bacterium]
MTTRLFLLIAILLLILPIGLFAQTGDDVAARRATLERDLATLEAEIDAQRKVLEAKQQESASLERDIAIIDAKIKEADLSIKARNLTITKLSQDIAGKEKRIGELTGKIGRERESLGELIRKTRELDDSSLLELVLSRQNVSEFFADADTFSSVGKALQDSVVVVSENREETATEKKSLEEKKQEETSLRAIQELQRKRIAQDKAAKNELLKVTKGKEDEYKKVIKEREKSAAIIRSELFSLQGSKAISFGKALDLANLAYQKTGVRPAFLLGVITEETNLGENLGTGSWLVDMHPTRDRPIFDDITRDLGFNPDAMPVSKKAWYGYGGAMGPAQFIPSTWVLYAGYAEEGKGSGNWTYSESKDRVGALTGHQPPSPWEPEDAFMAAAILLKDNGGAGGSYTKERLAALRYLAGWTNATKKSYAFYGDDVMQIAAKYQAQIDILQQVAAR